MHLQRIQKHGDAHKTSRIIGDRIAAFWSHVDKTETCWIWKASLHEYGYGVFWANRDGKYRSLRAHRFAWELLKGAITPGMQLDHVCHNRACVNPDHLRETTNKQNHENYRGTHSTNTTGYRGVYWSSAESRYRVQVTHKGKRYSGGSFSNADEANAAAIALRNRLFTHNDLDRIQTKAAA
jgi:hypothetical protein